MKTINYWQCDAEEETGILRGKPVANVYEKERAVSIESGGTYSKGKLQSKISLIHLHIKMRNVMMLMNV
jgi:hypothetical protein